MRPCSVCQAEYLCCRTVAWLDPSQSSSAPSRGPKKIRPATGRKQVSRLFPASHSPLPFALFPSSASIQYEG